LRINRAAPVLFVAQVEATRDFFKRVGFAVDDLDAVIAALDGEKIPVERHKTFYDSDELTCQEPGGHLVTFARFA
jgi:hypothetical protein